MKNYPVGKEFKGVKNEAHFVPEQLSFWEKRL